MDYRRSQEAARFAERRKQQEYAAKFAEAAAAGQVAVVDAIGRPVQPGDLVTITALPLATVFRVAAADPVLADPRLAGMIQVRFVADFSVYLPSGQPQGLLLISPAEVSTGVVGDAAAADAANPARMDLGPQQGPALVTITD